MLPYFGYSSTGICPSFPLLSRHKQIQQEAGGYFTIRRDAQGLERRLAVKRMPWDSIRRLKHKEVGRGSSVSGSTAFHHNSHRKVPHGKRDHCASTLPFFFVAMVLAMLVIVAFPKSFQRSCG